VILMKSPIHAALEGFAPSMMDDIAQRLDRFPMFSATQDDLAAVTLAEAVPLYFDGEGRIVLPQDLIAHAGLVDDAAFVGLGRKFQIWAPSIWEKRRGSAQEAVKSKGLALP
jgi:MraZ protein